MRIDRRPKALLGLLTLLAIACGGAAQSGRDAPAPPPVRSSSEVPEWVLRMPRREGQICATGAVDPTYFRQDGRTNAAESARNELARTIQVKVTSVMYDEQSTRGGHVDQAFVTEVVGSVSEAVISGAEIVEYWYDAHGMVSRAGMTYAMACMSTDASVEQLAERMKAALPDDADEDRVADVRERAKAAFEELEAAEAKKQPATTDAPSKGQE